VGHDRQTILLTYIRRQILTFELLIVSVPDFRNDSVNDNAIQSGDWSLVNHVV
jgi:hypothetical protein